MSRVYARYVLFAWYNFPRVVSFASEKKEWSFSFLSNSRHHLSEFCTYPGLLCGCILQLDQEFHLYILNSPLSDLPSYNLPVLELRPCPLLIRAN